jgi:2-methylcitrate dehydratase PrpD
MKSIPLSSSIRAKRTLSSHEPDQRSGTFVAAMPEEQFDPKTPILSRLAPYIAILAAMDGPFAQRIELPVNETERLARFAASYAPFPPEVIAQAKRMVLDQIGCQLSAATLPWSLAYRASIAGMGSGGDATVVFHGDRLALDQAAFLNGAFGHGNELDDTHLPSATHPGSVIIPPVLAIAETKHLSGAAALAGIVTGTEIMLRLGYAAAPHLHDRGYYVPCAVGPFGAAAGCSRVLGSDAETTIQALAVAGSHAGGMREFTHGGGSVKRIQCAIPGTSGLRCAVMASHGITGPRHVLEGKLGFFHVYAGQYDPGLLLDGLGEEFLLLGISFKPVACNLSTHAAVEAVGRLASEHRLGATDVKALRIGVSKSAVGDVGNVVEPHDMLGAQSSLAFCSAVRILRGGNGPNDYREEDLRDPRFLDFARMVEVYVDPVCDEERRTLGNRGAVVTIQTGDGRSLEERVRFPKGSPQNPLTDDELLAKFVDAVEPALGATQTRAIAGWIARFDQQQDVSELLRLCVRR